MGVLRVYIYIGIYRSRKNRCVYKILDRKGNGLCRFTSVYFENNGSATTSVLMSAPATLNICIDSTKDIEKVDVMFSIYNSYGVLVASTNSRFSSRETLSLKKGENHWKVQYDGLPLACGVYSINVRVWDEDEKDLDWVEKAYSFEIVEDDIFGTGKYYKDSSSILALPHQWNSL
jgi:hypothetical protein